ncbi:MAG TPA: aldolase [Candidatus Fimicola cottocaccae]|nr:aldolase [Candidatus Fimicola cottocaccae]
MSIKLMYITNREDVACIADECGVDRIFIDLEILGKEERQGHLDTVISYHTIEDVGKIRKVIKNAELLVRTNPINNNSSEELDKIINLGADIVMLPFFRTKYEVQKFVDIVNGRAKVCILLETPEAVDVLDDILTVKGIDEIHIGLNDLHIGYGLDFMFQLLSNGTVEKICDKIKKTGIKYGFGGISSIGGGELPAENILCEHYRLGSSMVILSRSFCDTKKISDINEIKKIFYNGVKEIRKKELEFSKYTEKDFLNNKFIVSEKVEIIVDKIIEQKRNLV